MKRILWAALAALLLCGAAQAQWTSITASNIHDAAGNNLAHGRIQFVGTDQNDQSISYKSGSGQTIKTPVFCTVVAGAITSPSPCRVADTALTAPAHICYRISVIDTSTGKQVLYYPQPAQKPACGSQPTGSTWNLDDFSPPYTPMAMIQTGPTGAQGPRGYPGFNCTNSSSLAAWNSGTPYTAGECVYYGSSPELLYAALQNGTGEQPDIHSDYWFNLDQWATGTVGQHLAFALTGTPQPPPAPYSISGMSVACDNVDYTYATFDACSHLLVNTGAQTWGTEFYRCNEYIPTGVPGGINCASTPPYSLPHWAVVDMGAVQAVGALGYQARLDGYAYGNVLGYNWYLRSDSGCGSDGAGSWGTAVASGTFEPLSTLFQIVNITGTPTARCAKLEILSTYDPRIVPPSFEAGGSAIRVWAANVAGAGITTAATFKSKPIIDVRDYGVDCETTPTSAIDSSYAINRLIRSGQSVSFKGCNTNYVRVDSPALLQAVRSVDFDGGGVIPGAGGPGYGAHGNCGEGLAKVCPRAVTPRFGSMRFGTIVPRFCLSPIRNQQTGTANGSCQRHFFTSPRLVVSPWGGGFLPQEKRVAPAVFSNMTIQNGRPIVLQTERDRKISVLCEEAVPMSLSAEQITSVMHEDRVFPPPAEFAASAHCAGPETYAAMYRQSLDDPAAFWAKIAEGFHWFQKPIRTLEWNLPDAKWFIGGETNLAYNCLDYQVDQEPREPHRHFVGKRAGERGWHAARSPENNLPRTA